MLCSAPDVFLLSLLDGASKSAALCISHLATYSVWMGLMKVWEDSGVAHGLSRLLKPIAKHLLKTDDSEAIESACMTFSANMLGISGAATPYGVKTARLLDKTQNAEYSSAMFFVLNAASLQILPSSLVAVRLSMGSAAPNDIIIPTLIVGAFSCLLSATLTRLFLYDKPKENAASKKAFNFSKKYKTEGAGTR